MIPKLLLRFAPISPTLWLQRSISHFITTPIFYVNASPHIGHVHTLLLADALNIYQRLKLGNDDTIFSTGTDEHGIKIQTAAESNNMSPSDFCDQNAARFSKLFDQYETSVTDFIRTTDGRHEGAVQSMWNQLERRGFIHKTTYSGWYCSSDEVFVPESQVTKKDINGETIHTDAHDNALSWSNEENYMFRLSQFEESVKSWLIRQKPVVPEKFNELVIKSMERQPIGDISISRPTSRLRWGVRVPGDPSQTIYVWLDALASYLTVAGYPCDKHELKRWPIDCQVLGKDIIKFHAIYWPAFLMAMSLELPKRLICHSHWLVDSLKMSKSRGNVIDPWQENKFMTEEGLRYYLLRASTNHSDTDYSRIQATRRINAELADTYGNLMSRCCAKSINKKQTIPKCLTEAPDMGPIEELIGELKELVPACENHYDNADFYKGIDLIMAVLRLNNKIYEETQPWKLVKIIDTDAEAAKKFYNLQAVTFETLRVCSILLHPVIPSATKKALNIMKVSNFSWRNAQVELTTDNPVNDVLLASPDYVLFRKIKT